MAKSILDQMLSGEIPMGINAFKEKKDKWESEFQSVSQFFWYPDNMSQDAVRRKIAFRADSAASYLSDRKTKKTAAEKEGLKFLKENPKKWAYMGIPDDIAVEFGLDVDFPADEDDKLLKALKKMKNERDKGLLIEGKYLAASEKDRVGILKLIEKEGEIVIDECESLLSSGNAKNGLSAIMVAEGVKRKHRNIKDRDRMTATSDMAGYSEFTPILMATGCKRLPQIGELAKFNRLVEQYGLETAKLIINESRKEQPNMEFVNFNLISAHEQRYYEKVKEIASLRANEASAETKQRDSHDEAQDKDAMTMVLQKACQLAQRSFESRPYQKLAFEDIESALKGPARACELPLPVGFGKTYLTPIISMLSNIMGHPFVYTCYTKATLYDAMKEARDLRDNIIKEYSKELTTEEWEILSRFFENGKGLLFIPSRLDGVRRFFMDAGYMADLIDAIKEEKNNTQPLDEENEDKTEQEADQKLSTEFLMPVTKMDGDDFYGLLKEYKEKDYVKIRDDWDKAKKEEAKAENEIIGSAKKLFKIWRTINYSLYGMSHGKDYEKEAATKKAEECEMTLRNFLGILCKNKYGNDVVKMSRENGWLKRLYPGVMAREAYSIYITFAKMAHPMEPFGEYRDTKLTNAKNEYKRKYTVFMDESDMFCHKMIGQKADEAVKYSINIEEFVTKTHHVLSAFLKTDGDKDRNNDEEDETAYVNKIRIPYHLFPQGKKRIKYIKKMISVKKKLDAFMEDHDYLLDESDTATDAFTTKLFHDENNKTDMPILNVSADRSEFISGLPRDEKGKIKEGYQYYSLVMKDNCLVKIYCGKKDDNEGKEPFTKYYRELTSLSNTIIGMFRYIVDEKMNDMFGITNEQDDDEDTTEVGYTRTEEIRSILDVFKYNEKQKRFVEMNMLHPRNDSVDSTSFYAQGFSIITMSESPEHHYSTYIAATRIMKLPDYDIANLIYNSYFVILASGTGSMASLQNSDIKYVGESVGEKMKEDLMQMTGCEDDDQLEVTPVFAEMPNLEEAGSVLKDSQRESIEGNVRVESYIYMREKEPDKMGCLADLGHYTEATGRTLNEGYLVYDESRKVVTNALEVGNYCYTVWALSRMIECKAHTGLIYLNTLPGVERRDRAVFNMEDLTQAARYVAKKYNMDPANCEIRRLDSKSTVDMKNTLEKGISDGKYILWCSQVAATGAGFSPFYYRKDAYGNVDKTIKYDVDSIFLGNLTNIIGGNDDVEAPLDKKLTIALEAEYQTSKFAILEGYKSKALKAKCYSQQNNILNSIFKGKNNFTRNLCPEDPQSPYCLTIGARILQEFARIDRGHQKNGVVLMSVTSDLIENSKICRNLYKGVPTTYLFDRLLDDIETYRKNNPERVLVKEDDIKEAQRFEAKNKEFYKTIQNILSRISKAKKDNEPVPRGTLTEYDYYRNSSMSFGFQKNGDIYAPDGYMLMKPSLDSVTKGIPDIWHVMLGNGDSDYDRQNDAYITRNPGKGFELKADRFVEAMDFYRRNHLFGKGWENLFELFLKYEDEIREKGFRHPILTETYYMLLGIFYENAFKAMSLPGGCYDIGYRLKELDRTQVEDADMMYEGTRVFIDIKGYKESHKAPDYERLEEKAKRYKGEGKPLFIILNVSPTEGMPAADSDIRSYEYYDLKIINGIGGLNESPITISERVVGRCASLAKLCEKYKD